MKKTERVILTLRNHNWDVTAKVVRTSTPETTTWRVDVYANSGEKLHKSLDCRNIREALTKCCDLVGED